MALVPTMGSLHEGHKALVVEATSQADRSVVSVFVNPLQFGPGEDFERYPRSLLDDETFLGDTVVDVIFAPSVVVMYPEGLAAAPTQSAGAVGDSYEGASRPGHFDGVLTVVATLFDYVGPDVAVFGCKDAQQLFVVQQMVQKQGLPVRVIEVDTIRDDDGLALSSRNIFLTEADRVHAREIPRALAAAEKAPGLSQAAGVVKDILENAPGVTVDYVDVVDPVSFLPLSDGVSTGAGRLILAATVGNVRLIDNRLLHFGQ